LVNGFLERHARYQSLQVRYLAIDLAREKGYVLGLGTIDYLEFLCESEEDLEDEFA